MSYDLMSLQAMIPARHFHCLVLTGSFCVPRFALWVREEGGVTEGIRDLGAHPKQFVIYLSRQCQCNDTHIPRSHSKVGDK